MIIKDNLDILDFTPWCGGKVNYELLTENELVMLDEIITELYPDGISETGVNDILWFDEELIAEIAGYLTYDDFFLSRIAQKKFEKGSR